MDSDDKKVVIEILGAGKFLGELSMLSEETRSANTLSEEVVTLELSRQDFLDFLRRRPDAAVDVLTELARLSPYQTAKANVWMKRSRKSPRDFNHVGFGR